MNTCRDLNSDDVKDLPNIYGTAFDLLCAVAEQATAIHDGHVASSKLEGEVSAATSSHDAPLTAPKKEKMTRDGGEASTSKTPVKERKDVITLRLRPPSPPLPEEFSRVIGEMARGKSLTTPPTLVLQKALTKTDVNQLQNRFAIPINQIADDFLTEEEKRLVNEREAGSKRKKSIEVKIIDPLHVIDTVNLTKWDMSLSSSTYNIIGSWTSVVERNDLKWYEEVQLWWFRIEQDLCFALVRLPPTRES